uniref:Uncharacterized protein n=1 Tax=Oryza sativa subsp. japonica TaxID=39947 RepID=Q69NK0_ORYSJ|nr:hypothetical protein [Oryza sativa Japonica Group]BAD33727.1 hypothetical protein [Oryza sativa Japonica Group]
MIKIRLSFPLTDLDQVREEELEEVVDGKEVKTPKAKTKSATHEIDSIALVDRKLDATPTWRANYRNMISAIIKGGSARDLKVDGCRDKGFRQVQALSMRGKRNTQVMICYIFHRYKLSPMTSRITMPYGYGVNYGRKPSAIRRNTPPDSRTRIHKLEDPHVNQNHQQLNPTKIQYAKGPPGSPPVEGRSRVKFYNSIRAIADLSVTITNTSTLRHCYLLTTEAQRHHHHSHPAHSKCMTPCFQLCRIHAQVVVAFQKLKPVESGSQCNHEDRANFAQYSQYLPSKIL